ncbi:MAG TPA: AAA family ATPase [Polyangiales bacterium]|nr:AAA family ATPase [Polyangiales bacterium]
MSEPELELRMLGGLDVRRAGKSLAQPPSKKTRALLAYLALTGRAHRREALCGLLWDVTDDPRGALRWSLSKLRKQVDDDHVTRLHADNERVALELQGASIDVLDMRAALGSDKLERLPTELLESWCARCHGEVLEGLDLPDFDGYQAWLVAEREQTRRLHASALHELVRRLEGTPERALPHARAWIGVDPMSAQARLSGMRLSLALGQLDEAKRQFQTARRVFSELDPAKEAQLVAGWQSLRASPAPSTESVPAPAPAARPAEPAPAPAPDDYQSPALRGGSAVLPLIGRASEQAELNEILAQVMRKRRAQLVLLTGEPGIGKSRLLEEFQSQARARGCAVLDGAAFEGETGRPYGPWIDALRKQGAPELERPEVPAASREALFSSVSGVLTGLCAAHAPVLVVLDDVHWLDEGSAELLHYTARMQREQPVLFVLAAREAELNDQVAVVRVLRSLRRDLELREIMLARLAEADTRKLVAQVDPNLDMSRLFAHSAGNPLFALELARAGGSAERARTVADAVRDRVAHLPAEAGDVLRWGAVLGSAIDTQLLAALSSLSPEQQLDGLETLERHALLRLEPGQGYVFSHEIVRGVIYSDLSQPRRTLMHHRAAEALRKLQEQSRGQYDEESVALIARHADLGGGHALAASAYTAAGKRCLKLFAHENAAVLARKGLRHARELSEPERSCSMLELLEVQLWSKRPEDAEEFCRTVNELAETALERGAVEHARLGFNMLSYVRWETGKWEEARRQMLKAEQVARSGQESEHIEGLAEAANCLVLIERDLGQAEAMLSEAKARAKPLRYTSPALILADGLLLWHRGETERSDLLLEEAQVVAHRSAHPYAEIQALTHRVQLNLDSGKLELALQLALEAEQLADKIREGSEGPNAHVLVALVRLAIGQDAEVALEQALHELRVADAKHRMAYGLSRAAALLNRRERHAPAREYAQQALDIARLLERPSDVVLSLIELARAQRALGDAEGYGQSRAALEADPSAKLSVYAERARHQFEENLR